MVNTQRRNHRRERARSVIDLNRPRPTYNILKYLFFITNDASSANLWRLQKRSRNWVHPNHVILDFHDSRNVLSGH